MEVAQLATTPITVKEVGDVLVVTYFEGSTDEQYREHLREMDRVTERRRLILGQRWAVVIDATRWARSNAVQRQMHADWIKRQEPMLRQRTAGIAFALSSAFVRGGLTAVLWLAPLPCPHAVVKTAAEGMTWARRQLGVAE